MENYLRYNDGSDVVDVLKDRMGQDVTNYMFSYTRNPAKFVKELNGFFRCFVEGLKQDMNKMKFSGHTNKEICNVLKKSKRNREYRIMGMIFQIDPTINEYGDKKSSTTYRLFNGWSLPIGWQYIDQFSVLQSGSNRMRREEITRLMEYSKVHRTMLSFKEEWDKPRKQAWKKRVLKDMGVKGFSKLSSSNDKDFLAKVIYQDNLEKYTKPIDVKPRGNLKIFDQLCYIWSS